MTEKDELYDEAMNQFGVKLDRRLKLSELKDQMERMARDKDNPPPAETPKVPLVVRNIMTGNEFPYTEAFAGNADLEVISWQDASALDVIVEEEVPVQEEIAVEEPVEEAPEEVVEEDNGDN